MTIEDTPQSGASSPDSGEEPRRPEAGDLGLPVPDPTPMLASTRERIHKVLSATDEAAQSILEAAKVEADAHVLETQRRVEQLARTRMEKLSTVTEDLLGQADRVRQEVDSLRRAIDGATVALAADLGLAPGEASGGPSETPGPGADASSTPSGIEVVESSSGRDGIAAPPETGQPSPEAQQTEGARESGLPSEVIEIFVLKMLATGSDRAAIERRLGDEFGVEDPSAVLERLGLAMPQPGGPA